MTRNINGLNINYFEKGNGPLIVLLHGWGSNISLFESMTENVLCKKYKTLAFDMPGFGLSDEPKEAWNVDAYADFVLEFLKDYNDKKIIEKKRMKERTTTKMFRSRGNRDARPNFVALKSRPRSSTLHP